ncbi:MAG: hypothetical protein LUQ65_03805 [Candidatus Helarchaeota archaeon]|nr:hypothetical protein [Candidatus Helarchaeota archaeon]
MSYKSLPGPDQELPSTVRMYFGPNEKIIYRFKTERFSRFFKAFKYILLGMVIVFAIIFLVEFGIFWDFNEFSLFIFLPLIITIPVIFLFFRKSSLFNSEEFVIFTNTGFYRYYKMGKNEWVESALYKDLKALIIRKNPSKGHNKGTIDLISETEQTKITTLSDIADIQATQRLIESILYHFGGFQERGEKIKLKLNFNEPFYLNVWSEGLNKVLHRSSRFNWYILITLVLTIVIGCLFYFCFPPISFPNFIPLLCLIMTLVIGGGICIGMVWEKAQMRKRSQDPNAQLVLSAHQIRSISGEYTKTEPLSETINLRFINIEQPARRIFSWEDIIGGFAIKPSYDAKDSIYFGPIDNFPAIYELLFCHILDWKAERGLLLSKEELLRLNVSEHISKHEGAETVAESEGSFVVAPQTLQFDPIDSNYEKLRPFSRYMDPDEKILMYFQPIMSNRVTIVKICVAIAVFIVAIMLFILFPFGWQMILGVILLIFPMMLCMLSFFSLMSNNLFKNSFYVFTNKKMIVKYPKIYTNISYQNIESIIRKDTKKSYAIELNLKSGVNSPFLLKTMIHIPNVPLENNLIEKINFLRDPQRSID